jgi:hypothetical protein
MIRQRRMADGIAAATGREVRVLPRSDHVLLEADLTEECENDPERWLALLTVLDQADRFGTYGRFEVLPNGEDRRTCPGVVWAAIFTKEAARSRDYFVGLERRKAMPRPWRP